MSESIVRAVRLLERGEPPVVCEVELPTPGPGEQAVTLSYAGINPVDRYVALGLFAADGPLPRTLGSEACGRNAAGELVFVYGEGFGISRDGVYATAAVVPDAAVFSVPDGVDPTVVASVGVAGVTAYNVAGLLAPKRGETVLVLGAGGGVGLPLVSYLTHLGARVVGQVGTAAKAEAVRAAGAVDVVVADAESLAEAVAGQDVVAVADPLGGPFLAAVIGLLPARGRYVGFGVSAGAELTLNWQQCYRKGLQLLGYGGFVITAEERGQAIRATIDLVATGGMQIPAARTYRLDELNEAFDALVNRSVVGKVVLDLT